MLKDGVSIILPVRNAAALLPACFTALSRAEALEVVVCDFDSSDDTTAVARTAGANVLRAAGETQARVVNAAVGLTRGAVLWFLAAVNRPEPGACPLLLSELESRNSVCGQFKIQGLGGWTAWKRQLAFNWRARRSGRTALLQGPVIYRQIYNDLGGFPAVEAPLEALLRQASGRGERHWLSPPLPTLLPADFADPFAPPVG